jgi:hypothetical protein
MFEPQTVKRKSTVTAEANASRVSPLRRYRAEGEPNHLKP